MTSNDASLRGAPSLLVLVRAAVEGEAVETMAEMQARVRAEWRSGEGSAGSSGSGASGERVERPFVERFVGLGAEGQTQAASLGVELASVLAGFGVAKATMAFPRSSRAGEETAVAVAARLSGRGVSAESVSVESTTAHPSLASPEDGDYPRQTEALESFARASRPPPGRALVCVSDDTRLLEAAAEALTRGGGKASLDSFSGEARFEHAKGAVFAYPADEAGPCEPRRDVSHE
jgi:hypothetical protein